MESLGSSDSDSSRHRYRHPEWERELVSFLPDSAEDTADVADVDAAATTAPDSAEEEPDTNTDSYRVAELIKDPDMTDPSRPGSDLPRPDDL